MRKNTLICFIILFATITTCFGQQKSHIIDSIASLLKQAKTDSLLVRHHLELGILKDKVAPKIAEQHFFEALKLLETNYSYTDKLEKQALANDCLGIIERRRNNYDKAFEYYLNALKIKELAKDTIKIGRSYHNIAMLFSSNRDYDKAIKYMQKALPIRKRDSLKYAISLNNYSQFFYYKKQYKEALKALDSAKKYYGNSVKIADANTNISKIYNKQKRYKEALNIQKSTLKIYQQKEYTERVANVLKSLAVTSRKLKQYNNALKYLDSSQTIAQQFNNKKLTATIYKERYRIAKAKNNYELALQHYKTYSAYEDSVFTLKQTKNLKQLELDYSYGKQILADSINFENQKKQLVNSADRQRFQKRFYAILFLVSSIALLALYFLYRYRRKLDDKNIQKQQLEAELLNEKVFFLRYKIERLLVDNKMRTNFNEKLSQRIKTLKTTENSSILIEEYQSILVQLKNQIQAENRLNDISDKRQKIDKDFELKLTEQFPELTKSEREVCHLISLNLTSKEVMNIRNISMSSVKSIRYRIRKKLNVPKGVELELFIQRLF